MLKCNQVLAAIAAAGPGVVSVLRQINVPQVHGMWLQVQQMHSFLSTEGWRSIHLGWTAIHI